MICKQCKQEKAEPEMQKRTKPNGQIIHNVCKDCNKANCKARYQLRKKSHMVVVTERKKRVIQENREFIFRYLMNSKCANCGNQDYRVLEFDHMGPKRGNIPTLLHRGNSRSSLEKEISNCQVLCANCHRRKTCAEQGWYQDVLSPSTGK